MGDSIKRTISVKIEFELRDDDLSNNKLTPQKRVEKIVKNDLRKLYGGDKGFVGINVKCADTL